MLDNLLVVDLSRAIAGPYCTMLLGDLGANVIKVEPPTGDMGRNGGLSRADGLTTYFLSMNRNKRSAVIDLQTAGGKAVLERLIRRADVLVENFRPGVMDRLGFSRERLHELRPGLVVCSISGYGQEGPYRDRKALDLIGQTMSGLASLTGEPDGPPTPAGAPLSDILTGLNACVGTLAALAARRDAQTTCIDVTLIGSTLSALAVEATAFLNTGNVPRRHGSAWFETFPYDVFPTADGWIAIGATGDWRAFCQLLGLDALGDHEEFNDIPTRLAARQELKQEIGTATRTFKTADLVNALQAKDILCGPVYNLDETLDDPAVQYAGLRIDVPHPNGGTFATIDTAPRFAELPANAPFVKPRRPPPMLGEHTLEVLAELGYSTAEIESACRAGAVAFRPF